jgi:LPXTG-motif cell wall-anchored protein
VATGKTKANSTAILKAVPELTAITYAQHGKAYDGNGDAYYKKLLNEYTSEPVEKASDTAKERYVKENVKYSPSEEAEGGYVADVNGTYYKTTDGEYVAIEDATSEQKFEQDYVLYQYELKIEPVDENSENKISGTVSEQDGTIMFNGLNAGTYKITELAAPAGYEKITDELTVTVEFDSNGAGTGKGTWKYSSEDSASNKLVTATEKSNGVYEVVVKNLSETTLPSTGGMGTTIFYAAGSTLAAAAAVMLIVKRRMHKEEESL